MNKNKKAKNQNAEQKADERRLDGGEKSSPKQTKRFIKKIDLLVFVVMKTTKSYLPNFIRY